MRVVKVMGLHRNLPMIREVVQQEMGDLKCKKGFLIFKVSEVSAHEFAVNGKKLNLVYRKRS